MIVLLEEIGDKGLSVEEVLEEGFLTDVLGGGGEETGFRPSAAGKLTASFERVGDKLLLDGDASLRVRGECRRCLTPVELEVPVHFELNLVARAAGAAAEDEEEKAKAGAKKKFTRSRRGEWQKTASFAPESSDEELYEGRQIDLAAIAREQILLSLPLDVTCREDCKGLCSACGQDLNVKECGCERKVGDPRWAALKDIKL